MFDFLIFTVLLFLSAFFSSSETAFFSLSHAKQRMIEDDGSRTGKLIGKLKRSPQELLITILIGNNIVNLFTASYATVVATRLFESAALGIATGVTTFLILIFGEIIPKSFAFAANEKFARATVWPIYILSVIFTPLTKLLVTLNATLSRWAGHDTSDSQNVTEEEVRTMTRLGVESGKIEYREHEMIENIFHFDDITADQVMTPWYKAVTISGLVPVSQIAHFFSQEGYSRYPVHDGRNEDNIIGYVHINDILRTLHSDQRDDPLSTIVSEITRVEESRGIERIFRSMVREHSHIALVHEDGDEGEFVGLITLEDIIEEIMGEITDETDRNRMEEDATA